MFKKINLATYPVKGLVQFFYLLRKKQLDILKLLLFLSQDEQTLLHVVLFPCLSLLLLNILFRIALLLIESPNENPQLL